MRWRNWINEPPEEKDFPIHLAWSVGTKNQKIEECVQTDILGPDAFIELGTYWLPHSEFLATLPKP